MISAAHPVGPEEVMAYLDGELAARRASAVAEHVDGCAECRRLASDFREVSRKLEEWEVPPVVLSPASERPKARRWEWKRPISVLAFASVTAVLGTFLMFRTTRQFQVAPAVSVDMARTRPVKSIAPMIARAAQLTLVTTDFAHARERLESILKAHHGYVAQLTVNAPTGAGRTLDAALKVPSRELEGALSELKKLGRVETESQSGEEVTQQYVDLEARLANARNAEQRLTSVLRQQAGKMQDILAVEKEITRVRGEIEQMDAERKALSGRVEFATINVKMMEQYKAQLQRPDSVGTRLGNAAVAGYRHVADGAMGLTEFGLEYGLSIALWIAMLFWPARLLWRRYRAG